MPKKAWSSEFAQKQLEKQGWTEGAGLGRTESGIKEALKVQIKNDKTGIGHDPGAEFTYHWWDHVFNKAANSISIENTEDGVTVNKKNKTDKKRTDAEKKKLLYGNFVKGATLTNDGNLVAEPKVDSEHSDSDDENHGASLAKFSDKELMNQCGGRTAHKGARHGLGLSAKLRRIQEHEHGVGYSEGGAQLKEDETKKKRSKKGKGVVQTAAQNGGMEEVNDGKCAGESENIASEEKRECRDSKYLDCDGVQEEKMECSRLVDTVVLVSGRDDVIEKRMKKKKKKKKKERHDCVDEGMDVTCSGLLKESEVAVVISENGKKRRKKRKADKESSSAVEDNNNGALDREGVVKKKKKKQKGCENNLCTVIGEGDSVMELKCAAAAESHQGIKKKKRKSCEVVYSNSCDVSETAANSGDIAVRKKKKLT